MKYGNRRKLGKLGTGIKVKMRKIRKTGKIKKIETKINSRFNDE
jgi:hypothetical protein